jgi:molecular chaperone GrpE
MAQETTGEGNANENNDLNSESAGASEGSSGATPEAGAATGSTSTPESLVEEWKNRAVYLAAEMDNMRKRFIRDRADLIKSANEDLLKNVLPVYDNLFLALRSIRETNERKEAREHAGTAEKLFDNLLKGVEMTFNHFEQTLDRVGVKAVDAIGKEFDPMIHEAVGQSADANYAENVVTAELQRGFSLYGKPLRTARVIVNKVSE